MEKRKLNLKDEEKKKQLDVDSRIMKKKKTKNTAATLPKHNPNIVIVRMIRDVERSLIVDISQVMRTWKERERTIKLSGPLRSDS